MAMNRASFWVGKVQVGLNRALERVICSSPLWWRQPPASRRVTEPLEVNPRCRCRAQCESTGRGWRGQARSGGHAS